MDWAYILTLSLYLVGRTNAELELLHEFSEVFLNLASGIAALALAYKWAVDASNRREDENPKNPGE